MATTPSLSIDEGALNARVMRDAETFARGFVATAASTARALAPVRTGRLKASIKPDPVRRVGPWSIETGVSALAPYAAPVHEGARPHVIRPRHARALHLEPEGGRVVFARKVNHPGNRPNKFLANAVERTVQSDPAINNPGL